MEVKNCRNCKKFFNYVSGLPLCPECKRELENKFIQVKQYINDNKESTIEEVADNCNVPKAQILQWIKEDRLYLKSVANLTCRKCGKSILTGQYCMDCKNELVRGLNELSHREPKIQNNKVVFHTKR